FFRICDPPLSGGNGPRFLAATCRVTPAVPPAPGKQATAAGRVSECQNTPVPPVRTAWLPRSCSSSDMAAASMQYDVVRVVPWWVDGGPAPERPATSASPPPRLRRPHDRPGNGNASVACGYGT